MTSDHDEHSPGRFRVFLGQLTGAVSQRPVTTLMLVALLCAASLGITSRFLEFKTNRSDLIAPDAQFHRRWLNYVDRFGDPADVVIVIESSDPAQVRHVIDTVGQRLENEPDLFSRVVHRIDPSSLKHKSLQFLAPAELEQIDQQLAMYAPILDGHWDRAGIEAYCQQLAMSLDDSQHPAAATTLRDPQAVLNQVQLFTKSLQAFVASRGQDFQSPWPVMLSRGKSDAGDPFAVRYQTTSDGTMGFVLATPASSTQDFSGTSKSIRTLRNLIAEVNQAHPDVSIGMTGIPVLESDEMQRSQQDMSVASIISVLGVGLILIIGFRGFRHPLLAMLMLVVGIIWSMGYTTIAVGHLNILSVSFAAILIGLGIDFSVIYLARYVELRHQGCGLTDSLIKTSDSVGTGILTASVTTALAFFCATFTNFLGVAELGLITGGGVMLCAISSLLVLPALVALADRRIEPGKMAVPFQGKLLRQWTQKFPGAITALTVMLVTLIGAQGFEWRDGRIQSVVKYDSNLLNLQAEGLQSVELQQRMFDKADGSLLYAVSLARSAEQARHLHDQFLKLPTVKRVEDLGSLMPAYPVSETGLLVQAIHSRLSTLSSLPREFPQLDPDAIGKALEQLYVRIKDRQEPVAREAATALDQFLTILEAQQLPEQMQMLSGIQYGMLAALHGQFQALAAMSNTEPVSPGDFPESIRSQFVSDQGDWLVRVYPSEEIWDEQPLARFVDDVRTVDPEATGTPLQNYEASRQIRQSYLNAALYAFAVVWIVLLIDTLELWSAFSALTAPLAVVAFTIAITNRSGQSLDHTWLVLIYVFVAVLTASIFDFVSVRNTVFMLLPPLSGLFILFGILAIADVDLNPANLIVLPLILGIGVDYGVHMVHDFRTQTGTYRTTPSTMNAVVLTSSTSMLGFGSMLVSAHQGLRSLGFVLLVGVGGCLFVALVMLPAMLTLLKSDAIADASDDVQPILASETVPESDSTADRHLPFGPHLRDHRSKDAA